MWLNLIGITFIRVFHRILPARGVGHIYIIGAPRSGTTITYQKILKTFDVKYLDNYLHLTFGLPFVRGFSNRFKISQAENSYHGFVSGLRGAAEGLHFWTYWLGLDTLYSACLKSVKSGLIKYIDYLEPSKRPFLSCYLAMLGHVKEILEINPNAFVIILEREEEDIRASLLKCYQDLDVPSDSWFSLRAERMKGSTHKEKVDEQISLYMKLLEKDIANEGERLMKVSYEEMKEYNKKTQSSILEHYNNFAELNKLSNLKFR